MKIKTVPIEETNYNIAPLTFGQSKEIFKPEVDAHTTNTSLLRYSLNNAGGLQLSDDDINALPYPDARQLLRECLELNGLGREKSSQGEDQPAKATE